MIKTSEHENTGNTEMTNAAFFKYRVAANVTSAQIADWAGSTRKHMLNVETGREPVQPWMVKAVNELRAA